MFKKYVKSTLLLVIAVVLVGCAASNPNLGKAGFTPYKFQADRYAPKVDNFLVILDASSSMDDPYKNTPKLFIAKDILSRMNQTISPLKMNGEIRTFGQHIWPFGSRTSIIYGLTQYSRAEFEKALLSVESGGASPLTCAINAATGDLKSAHNNIAVIIVTDGKDMDNSPVAAAENMKNQYGDRLCIYTVLVGDDSNGRCLLQQIAKIGGCGFFVEAEQITSAKGMADFVEKVFLTKAAKPKPVDTDGDGVPDNLDKCPGTPAGVSVNKYGCPLDSDGDRVYDYLDRCPGTPKGVSVDKHGCPLDSDGDGVYDYLDKCPNTPKGATVNVRGCWELKNVLFDTAKWNIKPQCFPVLDNLVSILKKNPSLKLEIQGHTDDQGSAAYNKRLSEKRAQAVMNYLIKKGISSDRLRAKGFGLSQPVTTNDTPEGRAQNRRVELHPFH